MDNGERYDGSVRLDGVMVQKMAAGEVELVVRLQNDRLAYDYALTRLI